MDTAWKSFFIRIKSFIQSVKNGYREIKLINSNLPRLKIAGEEIESSSNKKILIVQIRGRNSFAKYDPKIISEDPEILNEFCDQDRTRILNVANGSYIQEPSIKSSTIQSNEKPQAEYKPNLILLESTSYKIISKTHDRNTGEFIFAIEHKNKDMTVIKNMSSSEIIADNKIFSKLSPSELYDIGFNDGVENILNEIKQAKRSKNTLLTEQ